jgi:hypothetical protein
MSAAMGDRAQRKSVLKFFLPCCLWRISHNTFNPSIHFTFNKSKSEKSREKKTKRKKNALAHHPDGGKEMIAN